jgi:hypothetical protein
MEPEHGTILEMSGRDRDDAIAFGLSGRYFRSQMQGDSSSLDVRLEERKHGGHGHLRFESDTRHPAVAGIEVGAPTGIARKRPIVIAQSVTQGVVARSAAKTLDVIVFIQGRNALRGELTADPIGLFDEMNLFSAARGCKRRGDPSRSPANDEHIARYGTGSIKVTH